MNQQWIMFDPSEWIFAVARVAFKWNEDVCFLGLKIQNWALVQKLFNSYIFVAADEDNQHLKDI